MKKFILFLFLLYAVACTKSDITLEQRATVATVSAQISSITGWQTFISSHNLYSGYSGVDYLGNSLVIMGTNFGTIQGTLEINNANYAVRSYESWTSTKIIVKVASTINAVPLSSLTFTVKPKSDATTTRNSGSRTIFKIVPTVYTRVYLECTHHDSKRTLEIGGIPQPKGHSYDATGYTGSLNANYVPKRGDTWVTSGHQSFIESVTTSYVDIYSSISTGNKLLARRYKYKISISERNLDYKGTLQNYTNEIVIETTIATNSKKIVSGTFRSNHKGPYANYWRGIN